MAELVLFICMLQQPLGTSSAMESRKSSESEAASPSFTTVLGFAVGRQCRYEAGLLTASPDRPAQRTGRARSARVGRREAGCCTRQGCNPAKASPRLRAVRRAGAQFKHGDWVLVQGAPRPRPRQCTARGGGGMRRGWRQAGGGAGGRAHP